MMNRKGVSGRGNVVDTLYKLFTNDDHLMRLLVHPYEDENHEPIDCLSPDMPSIVGSENHHELAREHVKKSIKQGDINIVRTNKVFIHLGRRYPIYGNHRLARQELIVDVISHVDYEEFDARLSDICDRIDSLIVREEITMGQADISSPIPYEASREYYRYQLKYFVWVNKR